MDIKTENIWLLLGDCIDRMKEIPDNSVDLILCDLPYGTTECDWDKIIPVDLLWEEYLRITTKIGSIVLTANQPFTTTLITPALNIFKHASVWVKNRPSGALHSKNKPMGKHEDVLVFSKGKIGHKSQLKERRMTYNPQGVKDAGEVVIKERGFRPRTAGERPNLIGRSYNSQTGFPNTILNFNKDESHLHPTQKPVSLMEYLIKTYSNENETVLDNCMGSGSTGIACLNTRRKFIGIELDPIYFNVARERIIKHHEEQDY